MKMRHVYLSLLLAAVILWGCDDSSSSNDSSLRDPFGFDVSSGLQEVPELGITVEADRDVVPTGGTVTLTPRVLFAPSREISFRWKVDDGATLETDPGMEQAVVSLQRPGPHYIEVEAVHGDATDVAGVLVYAMDGAATYGVGGADGTSPPTAGDASMVEALLSGDATVSPETLRNYDIDLDGEVTPEDASLIRQAVEAGEGAPVYISRTEAFAFTPVMAIHPILLTPGRLTVSFDDATASFDQACISSMEGKDHWDEPLFRRPRPGYVVFSVPPKYACLTAEATVTVTLEVEGRSATLTDSLVIRPLREAQEPTVLEIMGRLRIVLEKAGVILRHYVMEASFGKDEEAALVGLVHAASDAYDQAYAEFYVAYGKLDEATRQAWESIAQSMGMDGSMVEELKALELSIDTQLKALRLKAITPATGEALASMLCTFSKIRDISEKVAEINETVSDVLAYIDWYPINRMPMVGPVITLLSAASSLVDLVTGLIDKVGKYVPELGDRISIQADPKSLAMGATASISAYIDVRIVTGLCKGIVGGHAESLTDALTDYMTRAIAKRIPYVGRAFRRAHYKKSRMGWVLRLVYSAIGNLAGKLVDALGIGEYMEKLQDAFCGLFGDPRLPLDPGFVTASCGDVDSGSWECTQGCAGTVSLGGSKTICGKEIRGAGELVCSEPSQCGNGRVEGSEECDGSDDPCGQGRVCNPSCRCVEPNRCGNGIKEQGEECDGDDAQCGPGGTCRYDCTCEGGGTSRCGCECTLDENTYELQCTENPEGVTFTVVDGCEGWPDATACSGWHSVVEGSGNDPDALYPDGSQFSAYDCTIQIHCP